MVCPKDGAPLERMERGGITFDSCPKCRGVWIDRGELVQLVQQAQKQGPSTVAPGRTGDLLNSSDPRESADPDWSRQERIKTGFLGQLFDIYE